MTAALVAFLRARLAEDEQAALAAARTVYAEWGGDMHKHASRDLLRLLVAPYAQHPDYDAAWKP